MIDLRSSLKKLSKLRPLGKLVGLFLFMAALWISYRTLKTQNLNNIFLSIERLSGLALCLALIFAVAAFAMLAGLEVQASIGKGKGIAASKAFLASFVGNALGNSLGMSAVTSNAVRLCFYSRWGLSALETATIGGTVSVATGLGLLSVGGAAVILSASRLSERILVPTPAITGIGLGLISMVLASFIAVTSKK